MQEAFAALRGAAAKVDAAENEIQLFLQTEATEGEKPALRQLRHTLAQRLARNLHQDANVAVNLSATINWTASRE